jgi:hypothetical protein
MREAEFANVLGKHVVGDDGGIAANSPAAVVISASETPGATARSVAEPAVPSP